MEVIDKGDIANVAVIIGSILVLGLGIMLLVLLGFWLTGAPLECAFLHCIGIVDPQREVEIVREGGEVIA